MSGPRQVGQGGLTAFVESTGADRKDTAIILIGTAREAGLDDQRHVRSSTGGFYISDELADILYDEDAEGEAEVSGNDETKAEPKSTKKASGNRAAKNSTAEQE